MVASHMLVVMIKAKYFQAWGGVLLQESPDKQAE
jgi:hypothetical protein